MSINAIWWMINFQSHYNSFYYNDTLWAEPLFDRSYLLTLAGPTTYEWSYSLDDQEIDDGAVVAHMITTEKIYGNLHALICDAGGELTEETKLNSIPEDGWGNLDSSINDLTDLKSLGISIVEKMNDEVEIDIDAWELDEDELQ